MCEADKNQLTNKDFIKSVEEMYGPIAVIVNACGSAAHEQCYPMDGKVVALSPYHKPSRDQQTNEAAEVCGAAWAKDEGCVFHCNQTFHRGPLAMIATFTVAFNCFPQDRMSIF